MVSFVMMSFFKRVPFFKSELYHSLMMVNFWCFDSGLLLRFTPHNDTTRHRELSAAIYLQIESVAI